MITPLESILLDVIRRSGPVTFDYYMSMCLYHPQRGYYMQDREPTGVAGDYFTSADLHPIFARLLARQAAEMWHVLGRPSPFIFVEMGAGRGIFARDFLDWTNRAFPDFAAGLEYVAVEPVPARRARFTEVAAPVAASGRFRLLSDLEGLHPITGCFFSNELVDAFPVHIVTRSGGRLREIYVASHGERLGEKLGSISDSRVAAYVARYAKELDEGHRAEVNLAAIRWMREVASKLARGFVLTIDYGDLAHRLYTPDRPGGTLMAYRHHLASEDCYAAPGEQDLTAHVNFSALIDAGREVGLDFCGFTTQERFLMGLGEASQFGELDDPDCSDLEKLRSRLKLKRLLDPAGMGSTFKVLIQRRDAGSEPLTGLKFERQELGPHG